jgi:phosphoribosylamine---glycine ligase
MLERKATVLLVDAPSDRRAVTAVVQAKSPQVGKVLVVGGGGLLSHEGLDLPKGKVEVFPIHHTDTKNILKLAKERKADLVEVGQEDAIYLGVTDSLRAHGFLTFGVSRRVGRWEWDKAYARREMFRQGSRECLPPHRVFKNKRVGLEYIEHKFLNGYEGRLFIKAVYPCLGKGVYGVESVEEAIEAFEKLQELPGNAGRTFLVEDGVGGDNAWEYSGYFMGDNLVGFGYYQDHKRVFDGDKGPNTGGMGSVGPLLWIQENLDHRNREQMVNPLSKSLKDKNLDFRGILYLAGMYDEDTNQVWNIEFNTRNGGSEAATNIPGIEDDYFELTKTVAEGRDIKSIKHDGKIRIAIAGTALGYPDNYRNVIGKKVQGLKEVIKRGEVMVLGAGIEDDMTLIGGRAFWIVAAGETLERAIDIGYRNMEELSIPGDRPGENLLHFRRDIGAKALRHRLVA